MTKRKTKKNDLVLSNLTDENSVIFGGDLLQEKEVIGITIGGCSKCFDDNHSVNNYENISADLSVDSSVDLSTTDSLIDLSVNSTIDESTIDSSIKYTIGDKIQSYYIDKTYTEYKNLKKTEFDIKKEPKIILDETKYNYVLMKQIYVLYEQLKKYEIMMLKKMFLFNESINQPINEPINETKKIFIPSVSIPINMITSAHNDPYVLSCLIVKFYDIVHRFFIGTQEEYIENIQKINSNKKKLFKNINITQSIKTIKNNNEMKSYMLDVESKLILMCNEVNLLITKCS